MFADYFPEGDIPDDAKIVRLMVNSATRQFAIELSSDTWNGPERDLTVNFDIKRIYSV